MDVAANTAHLAAAIQATPAFGERYTGLRPAGSAEGSGSFSVILEGSDGDGRHVVLKVEPPWETDPYRRLCFQREGEILTALTGTPAALQLLEPPQRLDIPLYNQQRQEISLPLRVLVLEAGEADVADMMSSHRGMSVAKKIRLFRSICHAVALLHSEGVCHRDLKPSNLFVFPKRMIKVGDFGSAAFAGREDGPMLGSYQFGPGDVRYAAPELLCLAAGDRLEQFKADFYSLGAILFELLTSDQLVDYLFRMEDLVVLAQSFSVMPSDQRRDVFAQLIGDIVSGRPLPKITDVAGSDLNGTGPGVDRLFQGLSQLDPGLRLTEFREVFRQTEKILRRLHLQGIRSAREQQLETWRRSRSLARRFR